jgi:hypothetical protein
MNFTYRLTRDTDLDETGHFPVVMEGELHDINFEDACNVVEEIRNLHGDDVFANLHDTDGVGSFACFPTLALELEEHAWFLRREDELGRRLIYVEELDKWI